MRKIMHAMYERAKLRMGEWVSRFQPDPPMPQFALDIAGCVILDGWSSRANKHYVAILLRTLDASFQLVSAAFMSVCPMWLAYVCNISIMLMHLPLSLFRPLSACR